MVHVYIRIYAYVPLWAVIVRKFDILTFKIIRVKYRVHVILEVLLFRYE